jgi:lambda repressor-like predicted transcriptional regulator
MVKKLKQFDTKQAKALKTAESAYFYARRVIEGRWPKAEMVIAKNPEWAYKYAQSVIKGRWPEAEMVIAKSKFWAHKYATEVRLKIKYCPNCKGDLIPVPERLLFRCSTCRREFTIEERPS